MKDVLIKFPTRSRPILFQRTMQLYLADPLARVLVSADLDDETMNNPGMKDWLAGQDRVKVRFGNSKTKIEAINDGTSGESFDLVVVASDDMIPMRKDYAKRIVELFQKHFPRGDGVLHLNDGHRGSGLNTLPIMDRKFFDRMGTVFHPDYISVWADNEFQELAESQGRSKYVDEVVIEHQWIGATQPDELNTRNEGFFHIDKITFERRKAAGFPYQLT